MTNENDALSRVAGRFANSRNIRAMLEAAHARGGKPIDLRGKLLDRVYFDGLKLNNLKCDGATGILPFARGATLPRSSWRGVNLWSAYMLKADLRYADFENAFLPYLHVWLANLWGASFKNAMLEGADFSEADLTNTDFTGADLTRARFTKAKITPGTRFNNAKGLDTAIDLDLKACFK